MKPDRLTVAATAWVVRVPFAATVLCGVSISVAAFGLGTPVAPTVIAQGSAIFHDHCAVCHGERGRGDGPAAGALTPRPTNLASLTKRTGTFPAAHITAVLKGTDPILAHGGPTMMMWGAIFLANANGDRAQADVRIGEVVAFIQSIQEK